MTRNMATQQINSQSYTMRHTALMLLTQRRYTKRIHILPTVASYLLLWLCVKCEEWSVKHRIYVVLRIYTKYIHMMHAAPATGSQFAWKWSGLCFVAAVCCRPKCNWNAVLYATPFSRVSRPSSASSGRKVGSVQMANARGRVLFMIAANAGKNQTYTLCFRTFQRKTERTYVSFRKRASSSKTHN